MESATSGERNLLLMCEDEEFDIIIQELSTGEILNTIDDLHQETGRIQQKVNILQDQIRSLPAEEKQKEGSCTEKYSSLVAELKNSQGILAKLINKSMKCFAQHKERKLLDREADSQLTSTSKTEVHISNTVSKTDLYNDLGITNHSNDKAGDPVQDSVPGKSLMPIAENVELKKETVSSSNGVSHNDVEKKTPPVVMKSARSSFEGGGKSGGCKLIQEYSVKTPMDDIRAEIFKNVDKAAKENVSKLLVNNVAHLYNKDVKLRSKDDILAFKAEIESQVAAENNLKKEKEAIINQNAHEEATKTPEKLTGNMVEAKSDDSKIETERNAKSLASTVDNINTSYENRNNVGIAVTEVTISSSSTDRSPEPGSKDLNPMDFKKLSASRVEQGERMSSKNMLESASMLEKFFQRGNGGTVSSDPPMKNFKIRSKGDNSSAIESDNLVSKVEQNSDSLATRNEKNVTEDFQINADIEKKTNDSMTEKSEENEGNKEPSSPKTPDSEKPQAEAAAAPVAPLKIPLFLEENDEPVKERVYLRSWDPTPLLKELYEIRLMDDDTQDLSHKFIEMEGLMEKLPMNKKKATLLKTWKRRYFRAKNGWLIYFDNRNDEKPSDEVLLMGGQVHAIGNHIIGIDDGRGRYLMVRCPSQKEYEQWLTALQSQTTDNTRATYVRPSMNALKHPSKKVVLVEFGSMSIRAGILKEHATLPQLFFPNVVAVSEENGMTKHVIGFEAYKPAIRHSSQLVQPCGPTDKVDKLKIDFETLPSVFTAIFRDLKIASAEYQVMLILPLNIRDEDKSTLMNILMDQFKVCGVCMAPQALLALYSYNAQSGIIVDIGERLEVLPIYEGFVIDGGHTVQSFGAPKIRQSLRSGLTSENYPLYSPLEQLLVRLVMEETCYVSKNFKEDCQQYQNKPEKFKETLYLKKYNLPDETYSSISHSLSRFVSPEGLFNTDLWGMDYPTIQSLVQKAIEACPMDNRRHLCRSIYLSGGVTLLPGFASRLEAELRKHLNETIVIQVHASPQRYHAAYIGACALCFMPEFEKSCITSEEWKNEGTKAFQKWKMSS